MKYSPLSSDKCLEVIIAVPDSLDILQSSSLSDKDYLHLISKFMLEIVHLVFSVFCSMVLLPHTCTELRYLYTVCVLIGLYIIVHSFRQLEYYTFCA